MTPREIARQHWFALAAVTPDESETAVSAETMEWLRTVAKAMVAAELLPAGNERRDAIVAASGLTGKATDGDLQMIALLAERYDREAEKNPRRFTGVTLESYVAERLEWTADPASNEKRLRRAAAELEGDWPQYMASLLKLGK